MLAIFIMLLFKGKYDLSAPLLIMKSKLLPHDGTHGSAYGASLTCSFAPVTLH